MTDIDHRTEPGRSTANQGAGRDDLDAPDAKTPDGKTPDAKAPAAGAWTIVCALERLPLDRGVAAIVDGEQVAVFRLSPLDDSHDAELAAVSHIDPVTTSPVMARGLVGSIGTPPLTIPTIASPLHKQRYNLRSGVCLDDSTLTLEVFEIMVDDDTVLVRRGARTT